MNYCFSTSAHHLLVIHGAALERDGVGLVMPATSGSGKSTLCAGLVLRGWRLLSDEMIVIDPKDGSMRPLPRPISLKNESIAIIRSRCASDQLSAPIPNTIKGTVAQLRPPSVSIQQMKNRAVLRRVILPRYVPAVKTELTSITQGQAALALIKNAFNYGVLAEQGFDTVGSVVSQARCFGLEFSDLDTALALIEESAAEGAV